ncbi:caspase family protein [Actinokineospora sp. PR83]|uniref:caspase family protein n=1 Tax=Actinokineospora sp. PR83 TaxID=2884908 RepID=UPI001F295E95|nr:caspase family protein [Actinokineospora sp. PR83]MCG8917120.1 caspase family protein [Actinokineospora sp. PR83]
MEASTTSERESRALLIASGQCLGYGLQAPAGTDVDLHLMQDVLESHLHTNSPLLVKVVHSRTLAEVVEALKWLYDPTSPAAENNLLLYYTGHVVQMRSNETALVAEDSDSRDPASVLSSRLLHTYLLNCPRAMHAWIVDGCYSHGMAVNDLPQVVQGMYDHLVIASSSIYERTSAEMGAGQGSPFTKSLHRALRGLAYLPENSELSLSDLLLFLAADSTRRQVARPYVHYSGQGSGLKFRLRRGPFSTGSPLYIPSQSKDRRRGMTISTSEPHPFADAYLAGSAGFESKFTRLDGRSLSQLDLSRVATSVTSDDEGPVVLHNASQPDVWNEALELSRRRQIMISSTEINSIPAEAIENANDVVSYLPTEDDAVRFQKTSLNSPGFRVYSLEEIVSASGGSLHELERLLRAAHLLDPYQLRDEGSLEPLDLEVMVRSLSSRFPGAAELLMILSAAPGVYVSRKQLHGFLADRTTDELSSAISIEMTKRYGIVVSDVDFLAVPKVFADRIRQILPEYGDTFVKFTRFTLKGQVDSSSIELLQTLRATVCFIESHLWAEGCEDAVSEVFSMTAMDLFSSTRRRSWIMVVDELDRWLGTSAKTELSLVLGHAYRLADDYDRSHRSFVRADLTAASSASKFAARAALFRLAVQSGGATASPQSLLVDSENQTQDSSYNSSMSLIQLFLQEGSSAFRQGRIEDAKALFLKARSRLVVDGSASASLMVDVLKALGDVALDQDDRGTSEDLVEQIHAIVNQHDLIRFGRVAWAKSLQFSGDVARRLSLDSSHHVSDRRCEEADYWYGRASREYDAQELMLGSLITRYKQAEMLGLVGQYSEAQGRYFALIDQFHEMGNPLWVLRSQVGALKSSFHVNHGRDLLSRSYLSVVTEALNGDLALPQIDILWANLSVGLISGIETYWQRAHDVAVQRSADTLAALIHRRTAGAWLFAYCSST